MILVQNNNFQVIWFKFSELKILRVQIYILISSVPGAFSSVLSDIFSKSGNQAFHPADVFQKSRNCENISYTYVLWTWCFAPMDQKS